MFHLVFLRYRYENERLPPTYAAPYQKNFRNKLYSDAVKTCPSCKKKKRWEDHLSMAGFGIIKIVFMIQ